MALSRAVARPALRSFVLSHPEPSLSPSSDRPNRAALPGPACRRRVVLRQVDGLLCLRFSGFD